LKGSLVSDKALDFVKYFWIWVTQHRRSAW
jgi:hypothetical protein